MADQPHRVRKITLLLGLAALSLSVLGLLVGRGTLAAWDTEQEGPRFTVRCTSTGGGGSGEIGAVTCTLNVTGLPEPLQDDVSVTLLSIDDSDEGVSGSAPSATVVSADVPATAFDTPVFVSRQLPAAPPPPLSHLPRVPEQPPKSL